MAKRPTGEPKHATEPLSPSLPEAPLNASGDTPPAQEAPAAPPPAEEAPRVRLEVFLKIAGPKWDQLAGFKAWAHAEKLAPRSIVAWREELQRFQNKPTK